MCPIRPDLITAMDFQFDTLADGRTFKMLNVIDKFSREALAIEVDHSIDADHIVKVLDRLALERDGPPAFIRMDNGPELVAHAVKDWCQFNGHPRDELLNLWCFDSFLKARGIVEDWRPD